MDLNAILSMVGKVFPSANIKSVAEKAQQALQGTPNTLDGVSQAAKRIGIDQNAINSVFQRYGNTMQARALCSMLGTTPEALKSDADKIVSGFSNSAAVNPSEPPVSKRFPRLK